MAQTPPAPTLDVVIPALDAATHIEATLEALAEGRGGGLVRDVLVVDGGSRDDTVRRARRAGARVIAGPRGRGPQLKAGAAASAADWLLFLHADTRLAPGWSGAVAAFIGAAAGSDRAAVFTLAFDDPSVHARALARLANWRARRLGLAYGDQGLVLSRGFYDRLGGFRPLPLMEDVDLVRRIGRARLAHLDARAVTSAERYRRSGWWPRAARNLAVLALYYLGVPARLLKRFYG
ncbi:MAG TPA: TIGR04283 family arsenosugar biosynthesis glycosyltransferase [Kiloniellales bacterium]